MKNRDPEAEVNTESSPAEVDRRAFLNQYGKLALVAPPVVTALLSTAMSSPAIAQSAGSSGGSGGEVLLLGGAGVGAVPLIAAEGRKAPPAPVQQVAPVAAPAPPVPEVVPPPPPPPPAPSPERG